MPGWSVHRDLSNRAIPPFYMNTPKFLQTRQPCQPGSYALSSMELFVISVCTFPLFHYNSQRILVVFLKWALSLDFSLWRLALFLWVFISEATVESPKAYWRSSGLFVWERVRSFGWILDANAKEWNNSAIKLLGTAYPFALDVWMNVRERLRTFHAFSCFGKCLRFRLRFIKVEHYKSYEKRSWSMLAEMRQIRLYFVSLWFRIAKLIYACAWNFSPAVACDQFKHVCGDREWIEGLLAFLDFLKRKAVWLH